LYRNSIRGKTSLLEKAVPIGIIFLFVISAIGPMISGTNTISSCEEHSVFLDNLLFYAGGDNNYKNESIIRDRYLSYIDYFGDSLIFKDEVNLKESFSANPHNEGEQQLSQTRSLGLMDSAWPMFCNNVRHTGQSPYSTEDNPGTEKWRFENDGLIEDTPVISNDGTIYFGGSYGDLPYYLIALYPNGSLKWRYKTDFTIWGSSPAIDQDGTIYIGSWDDYLYAIYPNGTLKWRFLVYDTISSSPAIAEDGTIYFGTMGTGYRVYAVNPNGTEKWHYTTGYKVSSDPAIGDDGTIYIGSGDFYLYALYPNGTLRWRFQTGDEIHGHPSIADDGTIYIGSNDEYLYAIYPNNGTEKWRFDTRWGLYGNPSIANDGTIYVGTDKLYAIYPNGTLRWSFVLGSDEWVGSSSAAISSEGTIYIGTHIGSMTGGDIIAVNPDGTERWRKRIANDWVESSPSIGEDGTVYIGSSWHHSGWPAGVLYAFGRTELVSDANGPYIGIINEPVQFTGFASGGYQPYSYHWDFGDEETSEEQNPTHEYENSGNHTVILTVTDDHDNTSNDTTWANIKESNDPPDTPEQPEGNIYGKTNTEYTYSSSTTDSDPEDLIYYMWDWGDGEISDWTEPYHSGETCSLSHTWTDKGSYEIRVKAKDNYNYESDWSDPLEVYRTELTLNIKNNFLSLTAEIENTGDYQLNDVDWSFSVTGGILKRINIQQSDTIPVLPAGGKETISSGLIFGLGRITVTVTALDESKTANGLVIGPFIFIKE